MQDAKGVAEDESLAYECVIVDEAARVGPRDLMIALEQGKHTILVGDHRQLPQLLDQKVADRLERGRRERERRRVAQEEHVRVPVRRAAEGARASRTQVVRRVTLNRQYRMHPVLGDFISRTFYESQDPDERFGSGLPASHFAHDLPGTDGRCAAWMDVRGQRTQAGTSSVNRGRGRGDRRQGRARGWTPTPGRT